MIHCVISNGTNVRADLAQAQPDMIVLELSRREIEAGLIGDALDRLMVLSDDAALTARYEDRLLVFVGGYDHDPRELSQIPEVVRFVRQLFAEWPYLFHFGDSLHSDTVMVVLRLLFNVSTHREGDRVAHRLEDPSQAEEVVRQQLTGLNGLYALHKLPRARRDRRTLLISRLIDRSIS